MYFNKVLKLLFSQSYCEKMPLWSRRSSRWNIQVSPTYPIPGYIQRMSNFGSFLTHELAN